MKFKILKNKDHLKGIGIIIDRVSLLVKREF